MKLLIIDGLNLIRRIYSALERASSDPAAKIIDATTQSLKRALNTHQPSHAVLVMDGNPPTWRHRLFPAYKQNRPAMPETLAGQLPFIVESAKQTAISLCRLDGYEADDIIATLAGKTAKAGGLSIILSTDRLLLQITGAGVSQYDHFACKPIDEQDALRKFGVTGQQIPLLLALAGDSGLSIPGLSGVGIKTAVKALAAFTSIEALIAFAENSDDTVYTKIRETAEQVRLYYELFKLKEDIELGINLKQLRLS